MATVAVNILKVLFVGAIYGFLFFVARAIRSQLTTAPVVERQPPTPAPPEPGPPIVIEITDADGVVRTVEVAPGSVAGRSPEADLVIDDPFASDLHVRFDRREGALWVEDLGSTNGTLVGDVTIDGPVVVADGAAVAVGRTIMVIR